MKSLADLQAIRDRAKLQVSARIENNGYKIIVGMATCGIAAGARPVMTEFLNRVTTDKLDNVTVSQTGCIGVCRLEPVVEIFSPDGDKTTYVHMTAEKVDKIINQHIKGGKPVMEYTIGADSE